MKRTTARTGRCLCGLAVALHFDKENRKLSCEETRRRHPRAHVKRTGLLEQLFQLRKGAS